MPDGRAASEGPSLREPKVPGALRRYGGVAGADHNTVDRDAKWVGDELGDRDSLPCPCGEIPDQTVDGTGGRNLDLGAVPASTDGSKKTAMPIRPAFPRRGSLDALRSVSRSSCSSAISSERG